jgi:hypothetical protein
MSALKNKIKEVIQSMKFYIRLEIIVYLGMIALIIIKKYDVMDIIFNAIIIELCFNEIVNYVINLKETFLVHKYAKESKEFNKEYFSLYYNTNVIRVRILVFLEYLSCILYSKFGSDFLAKLSDIDYWYKIQVIVIAIFQVFAYLLVGFGAWVIAMLCFNRLENIKKLDRLIEKKKENFVTYTDEERDILES